LKWAQTVFPINENKWELAPNPDPNNRKITGGGAPGCQYTVPDPWVCVNGKTPWAPGREMTQPDQLQ
jgi:hypothetical protein